MSKASRERRAGGGYYGEKEGDEKRREEKRRKEREDKGLLQSNVVQGRCLDMGLCRAFLMRLLFNVKADCI
jgi:hypothetical protein